MEFGSIQAWLRSAELYFQNLPGSLIFPLTSLYGSSLFVLS